MEEYMSSRAKYKAIAIYTFKSINCDGKTSISTHKLKDCMRNTILHFQPSTDSESIDSIINRANPFQKASVELEEFCEIFEKSFHLL
jgi:Ca2+-binding EF-hand superfamily protein